MIVSITRPKNRTTVVLRDAKNEEYLCANAAELWDQVSELLADPELQKIETVPAPKAEQKQESAAPETSGDLSDIISGGLVAAGARLLEMAQEQSFRGRGKTEGGGG